MIMELEEVTTCIHQTLRPLWEREPLNGMRGLFLLFLYPLILKLPRLLVILKVKHYS